MESAPGYRGRVEGEVGAGWDEMQARGVASAERLMRQSGRCWAAGMPGCRGSWHTGLGDPNNREARPKTVADMGPGRVLEERQRGRESLQARCDRLPQR